MFNSDKWPETELVLEPSGKAPKHYGPGIYRFYASLTLGVIMPRRGWQVMKKLKDYIYLQPPLTSLGPPFIVKIKVPTRDQAIECANLLFERGESWRGQIGEWPFQYLHRYEQVTIETRYSDEGPQQTRHVAKPDSSLLIGQSGIWSVELHKADGGDFTFYETGKFNKRPIVNNVPDLFSEGRPIEVELTKYERDPIARAKCIEYYGATCHVCKFDFGKHYGSIGEGFIHVHHLTRIADIGDEHQINPITDLIPLCPNCHAMIHAKTPHYSIEELKKLYRA